MRKWDKVVSEFAREKGIPVGEMKVIAETPFRFMKEVAIPEKKNFRIIGFGMFYSPPWFKDLVDKRKAIKLAYYEARRDAIEKMKADYEANRNKQ